MRPPTMLSPYAVAKAKELKPAYEGGASSSSRTFDTKFALNEEKKQQTWAAEEGAQKAWHNQERGKNWSGARRWNNPKDADKQWKPKS